MKSYNNKFCGKKINKMNKLPTQNNSNKKNNLF